MEEVVEFVGVQLMVRGTVSFVDTKVTVTELQSAYPDETGMGGDSYGVGLEKADTMRKTARPATHTAPIWYTTDLSSFVRFKTSRYRIG